MSFRTSAYLLLALLIASCQSGNQPVVSDDPGGPSYATTVANHFDQNRLSDYWYKGEAEITRFDLQQNRYGAVHPGEAIAIFVTEDFLTDKQVKNDRYQSDQSIPILKNNLMVKFQTGLYDYSIMTSVFTPVNNRNLPATLKVTNSSQDWCGQTFMQLNYRQNAYQLQLRSYFENEADLDKEVGQAILEDELLNRVRINPQALPTGDIKIFPGTTVTRLKHLEFKALDARASLQAYAGEEFTGSDLQVYRLEYPGLNRTYEIIFESEKPYKIAGWKDTYPSMFDGELRSTIARRTKTIMSPYWKKNSPEDQELRAALEAKTE